AWSSNQNQKFLDQWGQLWNQTIAKEAFSQTAMMQPVDPLLLNAWLGPDLVNLTPLELTLTAWGAYAGDSLGPHVLEVIATHIRRIAPENTPLAALETLAMQVMLSAQPIFDPRQARSWVKSFEKVEQESTGAISQSSEDDPSTEDAKADTQKLKKIEKVSTPSSSLLERMAESGLLVPYPNHKMRFTHAVFAGYLAGHAMTSYSAEENILNQPDWSGKYLALRYFAAHGDASKVVHTLLEFSRLPMHRPLFAAARRF